MLPASYNLTIYAGDDYTLQVRLREKNTDGLAGDPVDLSGCSATSQIRATKTSTTVLASFTCTIPGDPQTGIINMTLPHTVTATLGSGVFDMQVTFPDGSIKTYIGGTVTVTQEVTR